jgi:hypothetical protein
MADQLAFLPERVLTAAAMPGAGYKVSFYQSGTMAPVTVYTSPDLSTEHVQPLVCDATGVFPQVFSAGGAIKAVVQKPDNSTFYTVDPVLRVSTSASGAVEVTFAATVDLPFTNVQDAIVGAAASAASGFTPFGLGVTGTNALIANLDTTGTASGAYRFDATTVGVFPTGVVASDTGTVQIWRENAGDAVMWLQSGAADRGFTRRLAGSTWGAWREIITLPQGSARGDLIRRGATNFERLTPVSQGQTLFFDGTDTVLGREEYYFRLEAARVGVNSTALQSILGASVTVETGAVYEYELYYTAVKTVSATAHDFLSGYGGTAVIGVTSRQPVIRVQSGGDSTFVSSLVNMNMATFGNPTAATTVFGVNEVGTFSVTTGGTLTPQYQCSVAPGGAYTIRAGAFMRLRKIGGTGANVVFGPWA